jgi:hypothetical protein
VPICGTELGPAAMAVASGDLSCLLSLLFLSFGPAVIYIVTHTHTHIYIYILYIYTIPMLSIGVYSAQTELVQSECTTRTNRPNQTWTNTTTI